MPQLLSIVIVALGAWALYRFLAGGNDGAGKSGKVPPRPDPKNLPTLKKDPKTGVYRPEDD
ncbi:MAG: hypothetical protein C0605_02190 [Hyphomicrobiales bacterium]|nr:MAG: hypothetical protein C0605_02190 [Hyphomicrobiales bacterium]